jgi:hypothetical protein
MVYGEVLLRGYLNGKGASLTATLLVNTVAVTDFKPTLTYSQSQ